ncbi:hypothetical protein ACQPWY_29670 [Pseudonocardia xinjiangensis]|uniref:hypothetical protein n=1 Tax=Pseudonocardia xinjiangensis TaxID=75289 RepID=UPI003D8FCC9C
MEQDRSTVAERASAGQGAAVALRQAAHPGSHIPLQRGLDPVTGPIRVPAMEPAGGPIRSTSPRTRPGRGRHRRAERRRAEVTLTLIVLGALSWIVVTWPFRGDQAVYALIGRQILHGQALYTDIWDIKQPGVFLWYGLADLTGLGEIGTRALDVVAAFAFGACVHVLLRGRLTTPWVRRMLTALATAVLLLAAGPGDFGQLEMLCLVPATGAFALVAAEPRRAPTWRRIVLAGLCVGVVGVFKLLLAGVVGLALLVYLVLHLGGRRRFAAVPVVVAAALVPVGLTLAWLATQGAFGAALHVWLVEALEMGSAPGSRDPARVLEGLGRYVLWMFPVVVLAAWQAATAWRRRDPLDLAMGAFVLLDVLAIATQFAWWYQWYFVSAPLVVLALRRLDVLAPRLWGPRWAVLLAALCLPMLAHAASWALPTVLDGGGFTAASRDRIDERVAGYDTIRTELAAAGVRAGGSLYVVGDPLYNMLAGAPLVVRFDGWTYDLMTDGQWREIATEVGAVEPAVVMVDADAREWVADRGQDLQQVLARDYVRYRTSAEGTWYRLR